MNQVPANSELLDAAMASPEGVAGQSVLAKSESIRTLAATAVIARPPGGTRPRGWPEAAGRVGVPFHVGTSHSTDLFYPPRPGGSAGGVVQSTWAERYEDVARRGVLGVEMEASVIFVLARQWGMRGGAIAVVTDSMVEEMSPASGDWDPQASFVYGPEQIERLARAGSEIAVVLAERDAR